MPRIAMEHLHTIYQKQHIFQLEYPEIQIAENRRIKWNPEYIIFLDKDAIKTLPYEKRDEIRKKLDMYRDELLAVVSNRR